MGISVADNFDHKSKKPLDARTSYTTLALMKAVTDANINEGCLAYCAETDKYYKFLSTNTVDADTGKWREFSSGGGGGTSDYSDLTNKPSIESVTLSGNKTASDLGLQKSALATALNINNVSRATVEEALTGLTGLTKPTEYTGFGNNSFNSVSYIPSVGNTRIMYATWEGGHAYGGEVGLPLPYSWVYAMTDVFYVIHMLRDSDDTYVDYELYMYYTYDSTNYVKIYGRRATKSGSTWTFPSWTEVGGEDSKAYHTDDTAFTELADADYVPVYDTSATTKKKTLWSNVKSVLKTYFDTLYQKILTAGDCIDITSNTISAKTLSSGGMDDIIPELPEGNTLVSIASAFNKGDIYSTTEKMIGQWQDGKPLYQKTISFGALPNATSKSVAHGVSNIGTVVSATGFASSGSSYYMIPNIANNNVAGNVSIIVDATNITLTTGSNYSSINCYIILKYTKSTDSSVSIGEESEYSTSEKIVGSWLNGEKIYQKTITFSSDVLVSNSAWYTYSISGLKDLIYIRGGRRANATTTVSTYTTPLDAYYANGTLNIKSVRTDATNVTINYITIQYTKA